MNEVEFLEWEKSKVRYSKLCAMMHVPGINKVELKKDITDLGAKLSEYKNSFKSSQLLINVQCWEIVRQNLPISKIKEIEAEARKRVLDPNERNRVGIFSEKDENILFVLYPAMAATVDLLEQKIKCVQDIILSSTIDTSRIQDFHEDLNAKKFNKMIAELNRKLR